MTIDYLKLLINLADFHQLPLKFEIGRPQKIEADTKFNGQIPNHSYIESKISIGDHSYSWGHFDALEDAIQRAYPFLVERLITAKVRAKITSTL
jgi:hypothetical protein